jgi:hypothetical protein
MRLLVCLAIVAGLAEPCAATGPRTDSASRKPPRPKSMTWPPNLLRFTPNNNATPPPGPLLDEQTIRAVLFPLDTYAGQVADRIKHHRMMLENGGQGRPRGPYWPLLD